MLIATTGVLPPGPVADLALRLVGEEGQVSVLTVVPAPQEFLDTLELELWHPLGDPPRDDSEDRTVRYVTERGERLSAPVVAALAARGITPKKLFLEGSDPAKVIDVNRRFAEARPDVPLHLGVTEAGMPPEGVIKTRIAFEQLISRGIGDTIRVSLTVPNPRKGEEIAAGRQILADIAAGRVVEADESFRRLAAKHGLKLEP